MVILARYLVVPPGTVTALLPCLAKEDGTHCVVAEDEEKTITYHWFNFVRQYESNIEVVNVNDHGSRAVVGGAGYEGAAGSSGAQGALR